MSSTAEITKVVNFRLPFSVYEKFRKDATKKKITLTDYILKKLDESTKVDKLNSRIREYEKKNDKLQEIALQLAVLSIKAMKLPAVSEEQFEDMKKEIDKLIATKSTI